MKLARAVAVRILQCHAWMGVVLLAALMTGMPGAAQGPKPSPTPKKGGVEPAPAAQQPEPPHEMTAADLEAFLAGVMPLQLAREDIAGAVVLVVKDGKILFAHGYGYADVAKKKPVTPDATLFRPGSISKLFTWTAVMQQVEQGKLDLDRDVNDYIDFRIPATYPQPITLRDIMTHTPGFEEAVKDLFIANAKDLKPLGEYLKQHLPQRIFPPFTTPAYSNYATALAGYIVQRVSGQQYDDYIEQHILKPLAMEHTTFRQPLPEALKPLMSNGYNVASQPAKEFEVVQAWPAGSASVVATDMAHFMIAHLQDGQYQGAQILRPETARLMHARAFANLPDMNAMALGFYEETRNGHRIIGHGGDTQYFHSDLHLMPDANLGFFISYNSAGKGEISPRTAVWEKFLDRYFPYHPPAGSPPANTAQDIATVSGHYISSRRSQTTLLKVAELLGQTTVGKNEDGTLRVEGFKDLNGQAKHFKEIGPLEFRDVNDQDRVAFKRDSSGRLVMVIDYPFMVFQKAPWSMNSRLNLPILIGALAVFVLTVLFWPVSALLRRHYGRRLELDARDRRVRLLVRVVCLVNIAFVVALVVLFSVALKSIGMLTEALDPWLWLIQIVGWLGVLGTLIVLYNLSRSWANPGRWLWSKLGDALIALACLGFVWFVFAWNMVVFSLKY